jgi:membrane protein
MHWLLAPFRLIHRVGARFHSERLAQTSAALSFATLLSLVPMLVVGLAALTQLPFASGLTIAIEKFLLANLLPDKAGLVIAKYLGQFAQRANRVTLVGIGVLGATALMQMLTIEHAFNAIWNIKAPRPFLRRIAMHLLTLLAGPLAFGASLAAITFLASVSLGLIDEPGWIDVALTRGVSFAFTAALFALLYWGVPNKNVVKWHALLGGTFAALGFLAMQRLFGLYLANFAAYTALYGAFAAIPIFLTWLYLSWGIVLVGALVVAELPGAVRPAGKS